MSFDGGSSLCRLYYRSREHQSVWLGAVAEAVGDTAGLSLLDVGCGYGDFYPYVQDSLYTGIDANKAAIQEARTLYPDARFLCSTRISAADVIVAVGALQCELVQPKLLLRAISRKAGKTAVIATTTHWHRTPDEIHALLPDAELCIVDEDLYLLILRKD